MADKREQQKAQTPGRKRNAAQPLDAAPDRGGPERYPGVGKDDSVEPGGGDPAATDKGLTGPRGDPAEGKR
jgi:hypothetical protein